jgi:hypothetical protein
MLMRLITMVSETRKSVRVMCELRESVCAAARKPRVKTA